MARIGRFLRSDASRLTRQKYVRPDSDNIVNFAIDIDEKEVARLFNGFGEPAFKKAGALAIKDAREAAVAAGRANIRAAGFPAPWVDALKGRQYPKAGKGSLSAETFINYSLGGVGTVFEFGATIKPLAGKKWLWIPVEGSKKTIFDPSPGVRQSVRRTAGRVFNLSKKSLRFAIIDGKPALVDKFTKAKNPRVRFWGVRQVTIPKKWNVLPLIEEEADRVPELLSYYFAQVWSGKGNG